MSVQLFRKWQQKCICMCRVNLSFVLFIPRKKPQCVPQSRRHRWVQCHPLTHSTAQLGSLSPITLLSTAPLGSISYVTSHQSQRHRWVRSPSLISQIESQRHRTVGFHPHTPRAQVNGAVELNWTHYTLCWVGYYPYLQSQRHRWVGHHPHVYTPEGKVNSTVR